jgi:cytochrome P450
LDPRSNLRELHSSRDSLDELIMNAIKGNNEVKKDTKFLESQKGDGLDNVFLLDQIRMLFAAGHETTASTVISVVDLLCDHTQQLSALQSEIEKMSEESSQFQDNFDLLNRVIVESIRLRPATWSFPRRVMNHGAKVGQFDLEKDATLFVSPYVLHRNPKYWTDATQFRPERFSQVTGFRQLQKDYADTFLPFGAGDRICPGQWFALAEVRKIIYLLLREFRFSKISKTPNYDARLLLVSDSFRVQVSIK